MKDFIYNKTHYFISKTSKPSGMKPCIRIDSGKPDDKNNGEIPKSRQKDILIGFIEGEPKLLKIVNDLGWKRLSIEYKGITLAPTTHQLIMFLERI